MNKQKAPLIQISKRKALPWYRAWAIRAGAIVLALVLCAVLTTLLTGLNPLKVYATMFASSGLWARTSPFCSAFPSR